MQKVNYWLISLYITWGNDCNHCIRLIIMDIWSEYTKLSNLHLFLKMLLTLCFHFWGVNDSYWGQICKPSCLVIVLHCLCVLWQVGKQREIEEVGHNPQMLAQHGILVDTDLHQDLSALRVSSENRRWDTNKSRNASLPDSQFSDGGLCHSSFWRDWTWKATVLHWLRLQTIKWRC